MNAVYPSTGLLVYLMSLMVILVVKCSKGAARKSKSKSKSAITGSKQAPKSLKSSLKSARPSKSSSTTPTSSKSSTTSKASKKTFSGFKIRQKEKEEDIKTDLHSLEEEQNPFEGHGKGKKGESKAGKAATKTEETDVSVEQLVQPPTEALILRSHYMVPSGSAKPKLPSNKAK